MCHALIPLTVAVLLLCGRHCRQRCAPEAVVGPVAEAQVGEGHRAPVQAPQQGHMVVQVPCEPAQHSTAHQTDDLNACFGVPGAVLCNTVPAFTRTPAALGHSLKACAVQSKHCKTPDRLACTAMAAMKEKHCWRAAIATHYAKAFWKLLGAPSDMK